MSLGQRTFMALSTVWLFAVLKPNTISLSMVLVCLWILKDKLNVRLIILIFISIGFIHFQQIDKPIDNQPFCGKIIFTDGHRHVLSNYYGKATFFISKSFGYQDRLCVSGVLKPYQPIKGDVADPLALWALRSGHVGVISKPTILSVESSTSFKAMVYKTANQIDNNQWIKAFLFDHPFPSLGLLGILFISTGLQIQFASQMLRKWIGFLLVKPVADWIILGLLGLFNILWGWTFVLFRIFVVAICRKLPISNMTQIAIAAWICVLFYPNSASHIAFLIPFAFSFARYFKYRPWVIRWIILPCIQLSLMYQTNLMVLLLFPILRVISGLSYIMAWITICQPHLLPLYNHWMNTINQFDGYGFYQWFTITGKLSVPLFGLVIIYLFKNHLTNIQYFIRTTVILFVFLAFFVLNPFFRVIFFNVGQGDAALIIYPFMQGAVMIDTGRPSSYWHIKSRLHALGISRLDYIILSHDDNDHSGGLAFLVADFKGEVIDSKIDLHFKNVIFHALLPDYYSNDKNDNSLITYFNVTGLGYLFLGDISREVERNLVKQYPFLEVDVIKLAHHGSRTSSDPLLIFSYQPDIAVISSDSSVYNHPHIETLKTLYQAQVLGLKIETLGDISFFSWRNIHFVMSSDGGFGIIKPVIQ